jgi:hypothetical protein
MLQDMDPMKAHCIFYVKDGMIDQIEPRKIYVLTVSILGIVRLTVQPDLKLSLCFM